ncbi:uncharacterized protein ASPGLDRAFT_47684 [Aspergillus glaucus CBS 516.65]|uniref:Uncharacterized protein n=1 Tax=Aspergillus glaucus CBS 516.65 TaxID=1160497 RepID=A0A1L9VJA8_ASPGL|nr:hypothetical protein ASPGLDRAFT_47684 [Aspergillus glaucus CBS 516.65]OJJ83973.1 hypothetical protein ASPGLDRAFT_47684 [Aspergillus glaucus CBS 516.65]
MPGNSGNRTPSSPSLAPFPPLPYPKLTHPSPNQTEGSNPLNNISDQFNKATGNAKDTLNNATGGLGDKTNNATSGGQNVSNKFGNATGNLRQQARDFIGNITGGNK